MAKREGELVQEYMNKGYSHADAIIAARADLVKQTPETKEVGKATPTTEEITGLYKKYLGRDPSEQDIQDWVSWYEGGGLLEGQTFEKVFSEAAGEEIERAEDKSMYPVSDVFSQYDKAFWEKIGGMREPLEWGPYEKAIELEFGEAEERMGKEIRSWAAGGGFEAGGYGTALAKGRAKLETGRIRTLTDVAASITQFRTNVDIRIADLIMAKERQEISQEQFDAEMVLWEQNIADVREAIKRQQKDWWQPILGEIAGTYLGLTVGGIPGAIAGGKVGRAGGEQIAGVGQFPTAIPKPTKQVTTAKSPYTVSPYPAVYGTKKNEYSPYA